MCVSRILLVSKRDPGVERLVQFVALAAGSDVNGNGETHRCIQPLTPSLYLREVACVGMICWLLASLLPVIGDDPRCNVEVQSSMRCMCDTCVVVTGHCFRHSPN